VAKEIGSFIKIKNSGYNHWVLRKSNAKNVDIDIIYFCFKRIQAKSLKSSKKAMDMVDVFRTTSVLLLFRFSIQSGGTI
jgi:hypothetical protein